MEKDKQTSEGSYENPWTYKGTTFTSADIDGFFGYVYRITNLQSGRQYIGRKYFWSKRKPRGGKRRVTSESDWKKKKGIKDPAPPDCQSSMKEWEESIKKYQTPG